MSKLKFICILLLLNIPNIYAQNKVWKGYFSYNQIEDVTSFENAYYAASENALFLQNYTTNDNAIFNSVNDFKPDKISAIFYSESTKKIIVGNENGLIVIINSDGSIVNKFGIIQEVPVAPTRKRINHIYEYNNKLYFACGYGISVINLNTLEFDGTYFIGPNGAETNVLQTTVLNGVIYAVTTANGIKSINVNNPFIYDFSQWQTFDSGFWSGIVSFNNRIVASNSNGMLYQYNASFQPIFNTVEPVKKLKATQDYIIITTNNYVYVLNTSGNLVKQITDIPQINAEIFTAATVVGSEIILGTQKQGLYKTTLSGNSPYVSLSPDGPIQNEIFRATKAPNKLWAVYGKYTASYNPYPLEELPISKFSTNTGWEHIKYDDLLQAKSISAITYNPRKPDEIFASSHFSGLLKITPAEIVLYNNTNTGPNGIETVLTDPAVGLRINGGTFDKDGNLWITNAFIAKPLKVLRANGQWNSYDFSAIVGSAEPHYGPLTIDKNGTKWVPSRDDGLIGFNDLLGNKSIVIDENIGNLPTNDVRCVAVDNRNQLWIGTSRGLRVLSSVDKFVSENELTTNNIVIQEGDLAQELFFQQYILDIVVDGANRKWVSIAGGGVFLVSPNGQQTIYKFDKSNSPLPSNNINDIEIDGVSGEVFFATDKGMVSFLGTSTKPSDNLANVYVYPNPVRPNYTGTVKISGLTDKANVKITDIEGNLVYETTSSGGTIEWDTLVFGKHKAASGVYMVFLSTDDGENTNVKKIMIIR